MGSNNSKTPMFRVCTPCKVSGTIRISKAMTPQEADTTINEYNRLYGSCAPEAFPIKDTFGGWLTRYQIRGEYPWNVSFDSNVLELVETGKRVESDYKQTMALIKSL